MNVWVEHHDFGLDIESFGGYWMAISSLLYAPRDKTPGSDGTMSEFSYARPTHPSLFSPDLYSSSPPLSSWVLLAC